MNKSIRCDFLSLFYRKEFFFLFLLIFPSSLLLVRDRAAAYQTHKCYFKNTDHELNVYRIFGSKPGKTMLILGGIQGNEPGGYLAADQLVETRLDQGNLIIVPRANFYSILLSSRGANGDMNRKFAATDPDDKDLIIVSKLKSLIRESDCLLNLHDGSGYYAENFKSSQRNPDMYGQSIIADCSSFFSKRYQQTFNLEQMANRVCTSINSRITDPNHHFLFHNHKTGSKNTRHIEQRKSATYFAVTQCEIPAFGIETSKCIKDLGLKVSYQTMIIDEFMQAFGIIKTNSTVTFPPPQLSYLLISINRNPPIAVYNNETLNIGIGDRINIKNARLNYQRGISVDIQGMGTINDLGQEFIITRDTKITVKKDSITCGNILLRPLSKTVTRKRPGGSGIDYLIISAQKRKIALSPGDRLAVPKGEIIKIVDLITESTDPAEYVVNFKGFVGNRKVNTGEDRGYLIDTSGDKLMRKYSKNSQGREYTIEVSLDDRLISEFFISLIP